MAGHEARGEAMKSLTYRWNADGREHVLDLAHVGGTHGRRYPFGEAGTARPVEVRDFFVATVPVTQALWSHVMGAGVKPALRREPDRPLVDVSWDDLTLGGGFLDR